MATLGNLIRKKTRFIFSWGTGLRFLLPVLGCFIFQFFAPGAFCFSQEAQTGDRLDRLLQGAKAYCHRLEKAALDFVCLEEIKEVTFRSAADAFWEGAAPYQGWASLRGYEPRFIVRSWIFDYQYVRKDKVFLERRTLIEENKKKKREENARLPIIAARLENPLFGPVSIFGEEWQHHHDFKVVGEEHIRGTRAVVIEAIPKFAYDAPHAFGQVWVREFDSSILKIAWDPKSIGNLERVERIAKMLEAEPLLTSFTEYGLEKNGVRFPSRDVTEEGYLNQKGKKFMRSLTTIVYKDYKFFTVETEVQVKDGR